MKKITAVWAASTPPSPMHLGLGETVAMAPDEHSPRARPVMGPRQAARTIEALSIRIDDAHLEVENGQRAAAAIRSDLRGIERLANAYSEDAAKTRTALMSLFEGEVPNHVSNAELAERVAHDYAARARRRR